MCKVEELATISSFFDFHSDGKVASCKSYIHTYAGQSNQTLHSMYASSEKQVFPTCILRSIYMWKEHAEPLRINVAVRAGGRKDKTRIWLRLKTPGAICWWLH